MNGGYDDGYASCPCFWGRDPGSLVAHLARLVPSFEGMRVLDLGCGEGKNAAYLAERGAIVEAIDVSPLALANARAAWPHVQVQWREGDVRESLLGDARFDLVIAYGLLHCLRTSEEISDTIRRIQEATVPDGWNIVCVFNDRRQELHAHPGFQPTLRPHEWFVNLYEAWTQLVCTDEDLLETHPTNNIAHTHSMTRILARKRAS